MTVGQLRRLLNTLPLDSDDWPITILDQDTAASYATVAARPGTVGLRDRKALIVLAEITD